MKIVLITETYPPEINGVAMSLNMIVHSLVELGHSVCVVRPRQSLENQPQERERLRELLVRGLPLPGYKGLQFGLPAFRKLKKDWTTNRPDLVHVATEGPLGWSAICVARKLKLPVTSSFHTNFHTYGDHYYFAGLQRLAVAYLRYIHNSTLATFGPSVDVLKQLEADGFKNLYLLSRGVDTQRYDPGKRSGELRNEWGADDKTVVAIYVGRLAKEKNIALTIRAYKALRAVVPNSKFVLVGDGPERNRLEKAYPDFYFAGFQTGEALARHYASSDVFLFASTTETFGNVVTEALASGLLVVAYDYAAPKQFIRSGKNGYLADFNNPDAYVNSVLDAVKSKERWPAMCEAASTTMRSVSWQAIAQDFAARLETFTHPNSPCNE